MKTKILIGTIVNTHGIRGELKVLSETDFPAQRYRPDHPVYLAVDGGFLPVKIRKFRSHQGFDLLTLEGMEDINLVERFRGCQIFADDEPIRNLSPEEFSSRSLIDCQVFQKGKVVGIVWNPKLPPRRLSGGPKAGFRHRFDPLSR
jgi:16S rRNA processing protein RimM